MSLLLIVAQIGNNLTLIAMLNEGRELETAADVWMVVLALSKPLTPSVQCWVLVTGVRWPASVVG